ncbi:MAG TPA: permease [Anaeromyxobacteraceae bacterium]|nr:permease [Anaeromyxobacteraceae bacterium]
MIATLKRLRFVLAMAAVLALVAVISPRSARAALGGSLQGTRDMLALLPPVFLLTGLLDVWVPREVIVKHVGAEAGLRGLLLPLALGSIAAGPLYAAFPLATMLLGKGARPANVFFFLGVWSSAKLPIVMFETAVMGGVFTALHVGVSLTLYYLFALLMERLLCPNGADCTARLAPGQEQVGVG